MLIYRKYLPSNRDVSIGQPLKIIFLLFNIGLITQSFGQVDSLSIYLEKASKYQSERAYEKVIGTLELAIDQVTFTSVSDSQKVLVFHQLGINHYRLRNGKAAVESWILANVWRGKFLPESHIDIIKTHINIANAYLMLHQEKHAFTSLNTALHLLNTNAQRDLHNLSRVYESLGLVARLTQDFQSSKEYLLQSYLLKKEMYPETEWHLIDITTRLFDVHKDLDDREKMIEFARLGLAYAKLAPNEGDQYYFDLANAHNNLGIANSAIKNTTLAITHFDESIKINSIFKDREVYLAFTYNNLILQYSILGRPEDALRFSALAKSFFSKDSSDTVYLAETLIEEGDVYFTLRAYQKAVESYQEAINLKTIERNLPQISDNPEPEDLILGNRVTLMDALYKKAKCLYKQKRWDESVLASDRLLNFVKQTRNQLSDRTSKKYLLETSKKFYELAVDLQFVQYQTSEERQHLEKALLLFDESKARLVYDALSQNAFTNEDMQLKDLLERERAYHRAIGEKEEIIWKSNSDDVIIIERDSILLYRTKLAELKDSIIDLSSFHFPDELDMSWCKLEFIRDRYIPKHVALMQYFVGSENVYVIYITAQTYQFRRIGSTDQLNRSVQFFLENLRDPNSAITEYLNSAHDLYALIAKDLIALDSIEKLIIIPDDILAYIPFECLTGDVLSDGSYQSINYLLKNHSINYAASLSVLILQGKKELTNKRKVFLGMASDYSNMESARLQRLPFAVHEVKEINESLHGDIYLNEHATKDQFLAIQNEYRNIHLSLHGFVNADNPSFSYLQFAEGKDALNDGKLYASEIYTQIFNSQMIVLSACDTGNGVLVKGEGILSLAHAFAYAGTKSTVLSLWPLSSIATAQIMKDFYARLGSSHTQDKALQLAKVEYINHTKATELAHPFYWAALIHYGNSQSINFQSSFSGWTFLMLTVVLSFLCYWIFFKRSEASEK